MTPVIVNGEVITGGQRRLLVTGWSHSHVLKEELGRYKYSTYLKQKQDPDVGQHWLPAQCPGNGCCKGARRGKVPKWRQAPISAGPLH